MRSAISAEQRLVTTLRFLATGSDYRDLQYSSRISVQAIGKIIPETCLAIYHVLRDTFMKFPSSEPEWSDIADSFKNQWDFEHCLGAMDGKHVLIQKPPNSGSNFYNYKGTFSVVLFAIVNANYEFIYVHEGTNGRMSDGGILRKRDFYKKLERKELYLPPSEKLEKCDYICPFGFIGDEAFALMENIWKPYARTGCSNEEKIFNYRLCRARRVVENAFGILSSRFKVFQKPLKIHLKHVDAVILATCVLHNFLRAQSSNYITNSCVDQDDFESGSTIPGAWRQDGVMASLEPSVVRNAPNSAIQIRNRLKLYYSNEAKVTYQNKMCGI